MPRGATALRPGDHVFIALRTRLKPLMDRLFDPDAETPPLERGLSLSFHDKTMVGQLHRFFGIPGPTWSTETVGTLLHDAGGRQTAHLGPFLITRGEEPDFVTITYSPELNPPRTTEEPLLETCQPASATSSHLSQDSSDSMNPPAA